jgi:3-hydroxymyristoyl/3-hydroxydecanoyl-(acyl carrier protein) dehydratase
MLSLLTEHDPETPVAFGRGGTRTRGALGDDVGRVAAQLPVATAGAHTLMVFEHDRYAFAVGLLAAWARGFAVALPPNGRPRTISGLLERPEIDIVVHDTAAGGHVHVPRALQSSETAAVELSVPELAATVFTSGTSGDSVPWPKTREQLLREVAVLARTFEPALGSKFVITVPPAHLYGLLFGVLLPWCTGSAFGRDTPLHPEAVADRVASEGAEVLVSVPVHLRAIGAVKPGQLGSLQRVFSSTAPLDETVARSFAKAHGVGITEVFGSTETGGIAWRRRNESPAWTPLLGVETSIDERGHLCVDSPFLPPDSQRPWPTADLAEPAPNGAFVHKGRADGVVKVGGRRVSLPHMQQWLARQPRIEDAAVTSVPTPGRGVRILAAVVAPKLTESDLRERMLEAFPNSSLPRRILFLSALPRESSGKLQRRTLLARFGLRADGSTPSTELEIRETRSHPETKTVVAHVHVPEDYLYFEGHFDTYPILPGVVQLHELVLPVARKARPELGPVRQMMRLKFLERIKPGDDLVLTLRFGEDGSDCDFEIAVDGRRCSGGRLRFAEAES